MVDVYIIYSNGLKTNFSLGGTILYQSYLDANHGARHMNPNIKFIANKYEHEMEVNIPYIWVFYGFLGASQNFLKKPTMHQSRPRGFPTNPRLCGSQGSNRSQRRPGVGQNTLQLSTEVLES